MAIIPFSNKKKKPEIKVVEAQPQQTIVGVIDNRPKNSIPLVGFPKNEATANSTPIQSTRSTPGYELLKDSTKAFFADPEEQQALISRLDPGKGARDRDLIIAAAATIGLDTGAGGADDALKATGKGIKKGVQGIKKGVKGLNKFIKGSDDVAPIVNTYKQFELGAFPKSLRQAEEMEKTPLEKVGFQQKPILTEAPDPLITEARKYKSAEEFVSKISNANVGEIVKDIPVKNIRQSDFYKSELAKAQKEIADGTYKRSSDEPIRLFFDARSGDFEMVDGYHRLAKALSEGKNTIKSSIETTSSKSQLTDIWKKANSGFPESQAGFIDPGQIATDVKQGAKVALEKGKETSLNIKTELYDRYAPIQDLIKDTKLSAEADPYIAARNYAGHMGKVENRLNDLGEILKPNKDILPDVKEFALLERYQELAGRGITKFPGGITIDQINAQKAALESKLGQEGLGRVQEALTGIRKYNDRLLTEAKDAGLISQEAFDAIKKNNEKYIPLQRLEYLAEQGENLPRGSNGFNVPTQSLIKEIKGSEKAVADPIESMVRNTYNSVNLIERNKVAQKVADLTKLPEFKDVVIPLRTAEKVQEKINLYSVAKDLKPIQNKIDRIISSRSNSLGRIQTELNQLNRKGIKEAIKPSKPVEISKIKRFQPKQLIKQLISEDSSKLAAIKRKIGNREPKVSKLISELEGLKTEFDEIKNIRRGLIGDARELKDLPVPMGMEKISVFRNGIKEEYAVPKGVGEALKGLNQQSTDLITKWASKSSSFLRMGATSLNVGFIPANMIRDAQTAFLVSKVGFTPLDWLKGLSSAIKRDNAYKEFLESGGASGFFEAQKNLPKTVKKLTESKGTKVLKTVLNPVELIRTVGETTELIPRLGVFKRSLKQGLSGTEAAFNARNATVDFAKSGNTMKVLNQWVPFLNAKLQGTGNMLTSIKKRPLTSLMKLSAIVGAPVIATYLHNTKEYPDIWNDISEVEKRNNFIIIYGDEVDEKGNPTQAIKIPKGDAKIFSNPLEAFLDYLNGKDTKALDKLTVEIGSDLSPVGFDDRGDFSPRAVASSLLPPAPKGVIEGVTNTNLYTGYDIVPQSMVKASPEQQYDENTSGLAKELGKFLGWSPKKIDNFISTQFGQVGQQLVKPDKAGEQVSKRFVGARGGQEEQDMIKDAERAVQEQADRKLELKRQAQKLLARLEGESPEQAAQDFDTIAKNDSKLAKAIIDLKEKKDLGFTSKDYVINELGVENGERSKFLVGQFEKLKTDEEKAALWDDLVNKKLITKQVADQMAKLLE